MARPAPPHVTFKNGEFDYVGSTEDVPLTQRAPNGRRPIVRSGPARPPGGPEFR